MSDSSLSTDPTLQTSQNLPAVPNIPDPSTLQRDNLTIPPRLIDTPPTPPKPSVYTPSLPCIHCTLTSSRCSLQNSLNHRKPAPLPPDVARWLKWREKYVRENFLDGQWEMYQYYTEHPNEPIRGLEGRCRRCVRDGVWCVLRQVGKMDDAVMDGLDVGDGNWNGVEDEDEKRDGARPEAGRWVEDGVGWWVKVRKKEKEGGERCDEGDVGLKKRLGGGSDCSAVKKSLQRTEAEDLDNSSDEDGDKSKEKAHGSKGLKKVTKSRKSTKFSEVSQPLSNESETPAPLDTDDYDADSDSDSRNLNSGPDSDQDFDPDFDIRSNVSSKTSFSRRSIKSTKSATSPLLEPSSSSIIQHPESPLPPPQPPEPTSDYVPREETWIWKDDDLKCTTLQRPKRKPFIRENHTSSPLFAAITVVEITKRDLLGLIPSSKRSGGIKQFPFSSLDFPFIAYVRSPGLSPGSEGQEQLLQIVRSQISDSLPNYETAEYRRKKGLDLVEGFLPLEARLGNGFLTQEDIQNRFALPSWRQTKTLEEFLGEVMVDMRRKKEMEEISEKRMLERNRGREEMIKAWETEIEGQEKEEKKKEDSEGGDHQLSKQLSVEPSIPKRCVDTKPPDPQPAPEPEPNPEPETEPDSDHDPEHIIPSTPSQYFSRRLSRLQHFWTHEAQPTDFEIAKLSRRNTLHKWRGEKLEPFNLNILTFFSAQNQNKLGENGSTTTRATGSIDEWLDNLDNLQSSLNQQEQAQTLGQQQNTASKIPLWVTIAADGGNLTHQQQADTYLLPFKSASPYPPSEPEWWCVADDMAVLSDVDDDEDILRFIGDDDSSSDDEEDDVEDQCDEGESGNGGKKQGEEGNEDGGDEVDDDFDDRDDHPLIDYFREVMMIDD